MKKRLILFVMMAGFFAVVGRAVQSPFRGQGQGQSLVWDYPYALRSGVVFEIWRGISPNSLVAWVSTPQLSIQLSPTSYRTVFAVRARSITTGLVSDFSNYAIQPAAIPQ